MTLPMHSLASFLREFIRLRRLSRTRLSRTLSQKLRETYSENECGKAEIFRSGALCKRIFLIGSTGTTDMVACYLDLSPAAR